MELSVQIEKELRDFVLRADFTWRDGVMALLGASGSGKSMLLKCIAGLERPDRGRIVLNGCTLYDSEAGIDLPPQVRHVGYLFQNYALFPNMTVRENILFALTGSAPEREQRLRDNIARFSLTGLEDVYPAELSGGQQQRAAFARMMARGADLLLLDEPLSALDTHLRWQIETALRELLAAGHMSAVLVTHDRDEAFRLAEEIAIMAAGQLTPPREKHALFREPHTRAAAVLTGCQNISRCEWRSDGSLLASDWGISLPGLTSGADVADYVGLRAHHLHMAAEGQPGTYRGRVLDVIESAFSYTALVEFAAGARPVRYALDKAAGAEATGRLLAAFAAGEPLDFSLPAENMMLLQA